MAGTGVVVIDGQVVYGFFHTVAAEVRLRVSVDEYDRLNLCEGRRTRVTFPNTPPEDLLVTAVERVPPFVWLTLARSA